MIGESIAVIFVLVVTAVMALRARKKQLALMTAPFFCIPLIYLIGEATRFSITVNTFSDIVFMRIITVLVGAVLGGAASILIANFVSEIRRVKLAYTIIVLVFTIALAFAYVLRFMRVTV